MRFIWNNRSLIKRLVIRETEARYKSTMLGLLWLILTPLFMLSVYAFVFSSILKAKWPNSSDSEFEFAIILYCGLIVFTLFAEVLNRAPNLILENKNYVKKVIFPVEILPIVTIGVGLIQAVISYSILLVFCLVYYASLPWTIILFPLVLLPFLVLLSGLSLLLSALGVFLRDTGQVITVAVTGMMFLSPIFFPITAIPEAIRPYIYLNPLTFIIEQLREVILWGHMPDWSGLLVYTFISIIIAWLGYLFFIKTRKGFADVL